MNVFKILEKGVPLTGRVLLSMIFIFSGIGKVTGWEGAAGYMASAGMPLVPVFLTGAILIEILGGVAVLTGFKTKLAAGALFLFLIPTTLIFHNFWTLEGPQQQLQMIMFMKNLAIMGGLATVAAHGAGPLSIDSACKRQSGRTEA